MTRDIIIGVDAGTSVLKAVAFTLSGEQLAVSAIPNSPVPLPDGGMEQDMQQTWQSAAEALRGLHQKIPNLAERVSVIGVTGQGDGTWLIDKDGDPVQPAWLWLDARASSHADKLRRTQRGNLIYQRTGTVINACKQATQIAYMKKHRPDVLERASTAFHCKDWLYFQMTGIRTTDPSEATYTFGNFRKRNYDNDVIVAHGLTKQRHLFPKITDGVSTVNALSASAAKQINLPEGIPVSLGYIDVVCTALGAGLYDRSKKIGCSIIGTTGAHMRLARTSKDVILSADCTGETMAMPISGVSLQMQASMAASLNLDWLVDMAVNLLSRSGINKSRAEILIDFDPQIMNTKTDGLIYHPYISVAGERGPFVDAQARASFIGLTQSHGFPELLRAVFEGIALAARDCYSAMGKIPKEIRVTGGVSRSPALKMILSSMLGAQITTISREETGAAGAAMIAAVATGVYRTMDDCVDAWVSPYIELGPSPQRELQKRYDRVFPDFVKMRKTMAPHWKALAQHRGNLSL